MMRACTSPTIGEAAVEAHLENLLQRWNCVLLCGQFFCPRSKMASRRVFFIHHVEQSGQFEQCLTSEGSFGSDICDLPRGVNTLNLDHWVKMKPVEQPIERKSVGSGNVSHGRTPDFDDHLDHCIVVFKNKQTYFLAAKLCARRDKIWLLCCSAFPT